MSTTETATLDRVATQAAEGLWSPALTPIDGELRPDTARYTAHLHRLLENGCHGVTVFGTTGEATSFSAEEREAVLEAAVAAGIPPAQIMVGTGCAALSDTVRLTRHALSLGCTQALMLPPFYYKGVSDEGLYAAFAETVERVGDAALKVYFYHFPKLSMVPITHPVIERLLKAYPGTFVGLKDSSGDAEGCAAYIESFPDLAVFPGTEALMLDMLEKGAAGCITASANVNGPAIRRVWEAFKAGDEAKTEHQAAITALRQILQANPMIPVMKHILATSLGDPAWNALRPPLTRLPLATGDALDAELAAFGYRFPGA